MAKRAVFKTSRPGIKFKDGRLLQFGFNSVTVVKQWPDLGAWTKSKESPAWRPCRPYINLQYARHPSPLWRNSRRWSLPQSEDPYQFPPRLRPRQLLLAFPDPDDLASYRRRKARAEAIREWSETIPVEVKRFVRLFSERQYHLLSLFLRVPAARDLADNRALFFALASAWVFDKSVQSRRGIEYARRWVKWHRHRIVERLGWAGKRAVVRVLARMPTPSIAISSLLYLRDAVALAAARKLLFHAPRVNRGVVLLVSHPDLLAVSSPNLIAEVGTCRAEDRRAKTGWLLRDCLRMCDTLERPRNVCPRSIKRVEELHDELAAELRHGPFRGPDVPFPTPPVSGNDDIVPILSSHGLWREGGDLDHCCYTYAEPCAAGEYAVYRVLRPERCTLGIRWNGKRWCIDELRRSRNALPEHRTFAAVRRWLEHSQSKLAHHSGNNDSSDDWASPHRMEDFVREVPF